MIYTISLREDYNYRYLSVLFTPSAIQPFMGNMKANHLLKQSWICCYKVNTTNTNTHPCKGQTLLLVCRKIDIHWTGPTLIQYDAEDTTGHHQGAQALEWRNAKSSAAVRRFLIFSGHPLPVGDEHEPVLRS